MYCKDSTDTILQQILMNLPKDKKSDSQLIFEIREKANYGDDAVFKNNVKKLFDAIQILCNSFDISEQLVAVSYVLQDIFTEEINKEGEFYTFGYYQKLKEVALYTEEYIESKKNRKIVEKIKKMHGTE